MANKKNASLQWLEVKVLHKREGTVLGLQLQEEEVLHL